MHTAHHLELFHASLPAFSMKETPLPLTVFAIMAVGIPFVSLASLNAARDLIDSRCPSNVDHMEIECFKFLVDRIRGTYIRDVTIDLKSVVVHDKLPGCPVSGSLPT